MKKVMKIIGVLFGIVMALLLVSKINHEIQKKSELKKTNALIHITEIQGEKYAYSRFGDSAKTAVLIAGQGTISPLYDFKALASNLSTHMTLVIPERAGYGYSSIHNGSRDIDTILEQTRKTVFASEAKAPYVLIAHSMGALEAIRWAQKYPEEVRAIVGLDPAVPTVYDSFPIPPATIMNGVRFAVSCGGSRLISNLIPEYLTPHLNDEEKSEYRSLVHRVAFNKTVCNEMKAIKPNATKIKNAEQPNAIPKLFFISNGEEIPLQNWKETLSAYLQNTLNKEIITLDCGHYLHNYEPQRIAGAITTFLEKTALSDSLTSQQAGTL